MHRFDIGIVIVSYNVRHFLERCLLSVQNAVVDGLKIETWVVDNASVDGTADMVESQFPGVNFIGNADNVGFSSANNQAIRMMDAKYVLLLNPDTILEEKTLKMCFDFMEGKPKAGVVGVRMIDGAGVFLPESKRSVPNLWNSFCKLFYLSDLFQSSKIFSGYNLGYLPEHETHKVEVLCGAFMFIRNQVLDEIGLLDEDFFMYGEDIDLSYRILKANYEVWYYPETTIIHYKGESTKKGSFNYLKTFYGAMQIYVNKHYGQGDARIFAKVINMAIAVRGFISGIGAVLAVVFRPILDMVLIVFMLYLVKSGWANYYFENSHYYDESPIYWIFGGYALIWVLVLWLNGYYDRNRAGERSFQSLWIGTVLILLVYALLPVWLRTSRAIILLGTIGSYIIVTLTAWFTGLKKSKQSYRVKSPTIAIVANQENAAILKTVIESTMDCDTCYFIAPNQDQYHSFFTNTLASLPNIVKKLGINEVVYGSEDVAMKDIIQSMTDIGQNVSFKIGSAISQKIIGSDDRNAPGEFFSLDVKYKLADFRMLRFKRILDLCLALIFIPFIPFLWILSGFSSKIVENIVRVVLGHRTWVGYTGQQQDYHFLPELPQAVVPINATDIGIICDQKDFKAMNTAYARNYNIWQDVKIVLTSALSIKRLK